MTHHTDAARAEFEAWARGYGTWEVKRDDDVVLGTTGYTDITLTVAWHAVQAAHRAPAAPVPLRKPTVAQVSDAIGYHASAWDCVGPRELIDAILMLAAAPQPPEAAPVQLPEHTTSEYSKPMFGAAPKVDPIAWYVTGCSTMLDEQDAKAEAKRCGGCAQAVPLYTEQQVRELLAATSEHSRPMCGAATNGAERKPLSDGEIKNIIAGLEHSPWLNPHGFARAIERAHGIQAQRHGQ